MIPAEKSAAVIRGVHETFGTTTMEEVRALTAGLSSDLVFRILVHGSPYVLRIMTRMNEMVDPVRIFACMRAAGAAGLAPSVRYSNAEDGISIVDYVEAVPLAETQALALLPRTLRRVHSLPPFPKTFNYVTAHNGFIWRLRKSALLPASEVEEVFRQYDRICAAYPRLDSDMVSCHSDVKPENILFDGERVWLTGWQAAFVNDRYFDLAVAANFVVAQDSDEGILLEAYFGAVPDAYQRARLFLMRQVVHLLSAAVFIVLASAGGAIHADGDVVSFRDFHRRLWAGEVDLAVRESKMAYGLVHWEQLRRNLRAPRFEEALGIVSERNADSGDARLLLPSAP